MISTESERSDRVSFSCHFSKNTFFKAEFGQDELVILWFFSTFRCLLGSFPLGTVQTDQDIDMTVSLTFAWAPMSIFSGRICSKSALLAFSAPFCFAVTKISPRATVFFRTCLNKKVKTTAGEQTWIS